MPWDIWYTLGVVVLLMLALVSGKIGIDTAMLGALTLLLVAGILEPTEAIAGFADPSVLMIAGLFIVASGLTSTGATAMIANTVLGRPRSLPHALMRLMLPVTGMSAFMNNTPIVAMYLPIVHGYAKRIGVSPSKLFMPLSFAAILGGACTLIGTSTNVAVNELYLEYFAEHQAELHDTFGLALPSGTRQFWGITIIGLPSAIVGLVFIALATDRLLPSRSPPDVVGVEAREYTTRVRVEAGGPIVGRTIEQAGLRRLPGLFLYAIEREGTEMPAVAPETVLEAGDELVFSGVVGSVLDLLKTKGLVPAEDQAEKVDAPRGERTVVEAVVSHASPLVGRSVRDAAFRTRFNAAIVAVHRGGQRVEGRIGDIVFQAGDTLMLSTHVGFTNAFRNSRQFYLVSDVPGSGAVRHERAWLAITIMGVLVALLTLPTAGLYARIETLFGINLPDGMPKLTAVFLCAMLMVFTRCTTGSAARTSINWQVLITIAAAIGVGRAMAQTGAADRVAGVFLALVDSLGDRAVLFCFFWLTTVFCQIVTEKGAAVLMFPIAMAVSHASGVSPEPYVITLMAAAACSFMTPVGFVTNLMVYGPGGYRFTDYTRLGLPLTLIVSLIAAAVAPHAFPFHP